MSKLVKLSFKRSLQLALTGCTLLSMSLAALAADYKINDRVMAPYGGGYVAATIVAGPNSRGEWRVHFDKTDSQRDKWVRPTELKPFEALGELKPGDLIQAEIMSAWLFREVVEVKDDQVLVHKLNSTHEDDAWLPKSVLRRVPEGEALPEPWPYPFLMGEFVTVQKGGQELAIGRFTVEGNNIYVGDYRVTDIKQVKGAWKPRFQAGAVLRTRRGEGDWAKVRIDSVQPGYYKVTLLKSGQEDQVNEANLAEEWDYDGFYAIAAPIFADSFPLKYQWLNNSDRGQMNGFSIKDEQIKPSMALLADVEAKLKAKYGSQFPGSKDCLDCPARVMDLLARRKQVVLKAAGADPEQFVKNQIEGYERHLADARQKRFWEMPGSFGAINVAAEVQKELAQNEADLAKEIARNKLIDPAFVFKYDRKPIVDAVTKAQAELAKLLPAYGSISSDIGQYSGHTADAEALAIAYVKKIDPQAQVLGAQTLAGGWQKDTSVSVDTSETYATISRYLSTRVLVKVKSPKYKFPMVYALSLYNQGKGPFVKETSVIKAFYK